MADNNENPRNLLVIKASAGSGKTYRLALEYIKHLLFATPKGGTQLVPRRVAGDPRMLNAHRQLLAITFTNKATDEMKQRIVKELYRLSMPGVKSDYLQGFIKESGLKEPEVRSLASQALNELLFDYSNFNVSTIDSFFQSILRNFARELDRDFNYDIQLEEDYAVRVAVHNFLLSLGKTGKPTQVDQWVQEYQRHLLRGDAETKKWKFFDDGSSDLFRVAKKINSEFFRRRMDKIREYLGHVDDEGQFVCDFSRIRAFKKLMQDFVEKCNELRQQSLQTLWDELEPMGEDLDGRRTLKKWLKKGKVSPLTDTLMNADEDAIASQFSRNVPSMDGISHLLKLIRTYYDNGIFKDFFQYIENNLGLLGLLAMIDLFLEDYRHETNSILIGDTNELIGTVLNSGTDFVYERVGTLISNFMIDEFQDTSTKQYENFCGLLRESLAGGNFNMLIGDAKQSIYRFRNADLTVFRKRVGDDFAGHITDGRQDKDADGPSSVNYRSSRNIIKFNNALFEFLKERFSDRQPVVDTYADIEQGMPDNIDTDKLPGYVRLMNKNYGMLLRDNTIAGPLSSDEVDDKAPVETVLPAYLLWLHQRYAWGRIGILVNKNDQGNQVVECILNYNKHTTGEKIPIISGESLLLNNSPIIRRIIAMLRFIDISQFSAGEDNADEDDVDVRDSVSSILERKRMSDRRLYTALNEFIQSAASRTDATPLENGKLLVKSLEALRVDDGQPAGDQDAMLSSTLEKLLPPAGELTTLVSIVETMIAHFKNGSGRGADVDNEVAFLLAFQDTVMQFSAQRNGGSVREFLKYWDEKKNSLAVSSADGGDAINIMTIHKAKGLEFDCVVIPYANWEIDENKRETEYWMPREAFADVLKSLPLNGLQWNEDMIPPLLRVPKGHTVDLYRRNLLGSGEAATFVSKQVDDLLIDNLNKTYVAMTRPRAELHIFADGSDKTVAQLLTDFAESGNMMTRIGDVEGWYECGSLSTVDEINALRKKKEKKAQQSPDDDIEPKAKQATINGYTVSAIPLELRVRVDNASGSSIDAGLRLHSLLSRVRDRNDVDRIIADGIKHGVITDHPDDPCGIDNVKRHVRDFIMDESTRVAAWFDPANKVYSERTITMGVKKEVVEDEEAVVKKQVNNDGIENLRPDRIIRRPDGTILVVDYKSGMRRDGKNCAQLRRYINKLRLLFPGTPIAGRIWYTTHDLIVDENGHEMPIR